MFTAKSTLKEAMEHPLLKELAPYFVVNFPLEKQFNYDMPFDEAHNKGAWNVYSMVDSLNALLRTAESGKLIHRIWGEDTTDNKNNAFIVPFLSDDLHADNRPYVFVVPGGGNVNVWNLTEGYPIANHFNHLGYHAFVLTYRVHTSSLYPRPLDDTAQAIKYIAENFNVSKDYITIGFSAGAYLVNQWCAEKHGYMAYGLPSPVFNIPVYAPVSWKLEYEKHGHDGFAMNTHGITVKEASESEWNTEDHVSTFPPTYIAHAAGDTLVDPEHSRILERALNEKGIVCKLEIGRKSGHGFAEAYDTPLKGWIERAISFYEEINDR